MLSSPFAEKEKIKDPTMLRYVVTASFLASTVVAFVAAFLAQLVALVTVCPFLSQRSRTVLLGRIFRGSVTLFCIKLSLFWKLQVEDGHKLAKDASTVTLFMCNHLSNLDPYVFAATLFPTEAKFVSKASIFRIPFGGWCMSINGDLKIEFNKTKGGWGTEPGNIQRMMARARQYLNSRVNIAVFPSGIRSKTGGVGDFKDGFFHLAMMDDCKYSIAVQPLAIKYTNKAWPRDGLLMAPATIKAKVGDAVLAKDFKDAAALKDKIQNDVKELFDSIFYFAAKTMRSSLWTRRN